MLPELANSSERWRTTSLRTSLQSAGVLSEPCAYSNSDCTFVLQNTHRLLKSYLVSSSAQTVSLSQNTIRLFSRSDLFKMCSISNRKSYLFLILSQKFLSVGIIIISCWKVEIEFTCLTLLSVLPLNNENKAFEDGLVARSRTKLQGI